MAALVGNHGSNRMRKVRDRAHAGGVYRHLSRIGVTAKSWRMCELEKYHTGDDDGSTMGGR